MDTHSNRTSGISIALRLVHNMTQDVALRCVALRFQFMNALLCACVALHSKRKDSYLASRSLRSTYQICKIWREIQKAITRVYKWLSRVRSCICFVSTAMDDEEKLVEAVRCYPCLWQVSSREYKDARSSAHYICEGECLEGGGQSGIYKAFETQPDGKQY